MLNAALPWNSLLPPSRVQQPKACAALQARNSLAHKGQLPARADCTLAGDNTAVAGALADSHFALCGLHRCSANSRMPKPLYEQQTAKQQASRGPWR